MALTDMAEVVGGAEQVVPVVPSVVTPAPEPVPVPVQELEAAPEQPPSQQIVVNIPQARAPKARFVPKPPARPVAPTAANALHRIIPAGAETLELWKRQPAQAGGSGPGQLGYIDTYRAADLVGYPSVEAFVKQFVVPNHGPGDFVAIRKDSAGAEIARYPFPILAPIVPQAPGASAAASTDAATTVLLGTFSDWLRGAVAGRPGVQLPGAPVLPFTPPPGMNPELLSFMRAISESVTSLRATGDGGSNLMAQQLAMRALDKIDYAMSPPPAPVVLPSMTGLGGGGLSHVEVQMMIRDALRDAQPQRSILEELKAARDLFTQPTAPVVDPLTTLTTAFGLFKDMFGDRGGSKVEKIAEDLAELKRTVSQNPDPEDEIDKQIRMVEKLDRYKRLTGGGGGVVSQLLGAGTGTGDFGTVLNQTVQGLALTMREIRMTAESAERRDAINRGVPGVQAAVQVAAPVQAQLTAAPVQPPVSVPVPVAPASAPAGVSAPIAPAPVVIDPIPPTQAPTPEAKFAPYPVGFAPYLVNLQAARNIEERVKSALAAFQFLGQHQPWAPYFDETKKLIATRDRTAIKLMFAVLNDVASRGDLPTDSVDQTVRDFEAWWDVIVDRVLQQQEPAQAAS